ncbi:MAG: hypothetical protein KF788_07665 [Piscinibacter sp.]|nr:hypothetical protein [Piscinibacter sp.]
MLRGIIAALLILALGGCSAVRFGYSQAPDLVYWWLDGYVDFDEAQTLRTREGIRHWFEWHRRTQLPDYARLLAQARAEAPADGTPEQACRWWQQLRERADVALAEALPVAAEVVPLLTPAQLQHIERRQAKSNDEFRAEYLAARPERRLEDSVERAIDRAEFLYGTLDERQRERVAKLVAASPFDAELWFAERRQRQQDALALLRRVVAEKPDREATLAMLRAYADRLTRSPREEYRRYAQRLTTFNCSFAAALHNDTTPVQRKALAERLRGWENDLRALASEAQ